MLSTSHHSAQAALQQCRQCLYGSVQCALYHIIIVISIQNGDWLTLDLLSVTGVLVQVAAHAAFSDTINVRKQAVELAGWQMTTRMHNGALFDAALLLLKAGKSLPDVGFVVVMTLTS